jgi:signal transduction histidine kinase
MPTPASDTAGILALAVHEFRTPVTVVAGYLRMLAREQLGPLTDRQRALVDEAERSCARLTALVAEMGELSDLEAGSAAVARDAVDLVALVDEVVAEIPEGRHGDVAIVRQAEEPSLVVAGDGRRLRGVLSSLLAAVLREQPGQGVVTVWTCRIPEGGRPMAAIAIGPGDAARLVLASSGPDARLNEGRGGLGLALPVARRVIERLDGRVWSWQAERTLGAVAVIIPLGEGPPPATTGPASSAR